MIEVCTANLFGSYIFLRINKNLQNFFIDEKFKSIQFGSTFRKLLKYLTANLPTFEKVENFKNQFYLKLNFDLQNLQINFDFQA